MITRGASRIGACACACQSFPSRDSEVIYRGVYRSAKRSDNHQAQPKLSIVDRIFVSHSHQNPTRHFASQTRHLLLVPQAHNIIIMSLISTHLAQIALSCEGIDSLPYVPPLSQSKQSWKPPPPLPPFSNRPPVSPHRKSSPTPSSPTQTSPPSSATPKPTNAPSSPSPHPHHHQPPPPIPSNLNPPTAGKQSSTSPPEKSPPDQHPTPPPADPPPSPPFWAVISTRI